MQLYLPDFTLLSICKSMRKLDYGHKTLEMFLWDPEGISIKVAIHSTAGYPKKRVCTGIVESLIQ